MEKPPFIRLNFDSENSGRPLNVDQLVKVIRKQLVLDNHFKGCRLPPVRALAHQLGLSKNTIQSAYDELRAQGLIESKDRSGLFVADGDEPRSYDDSGNVPGPELKKVSYVGYSNPKQNNSISLSSVFIDPEILPKAKLTACFKSVLRSPGIPEFNDPQGMPALREKIASRLRDRGMDVEADHIIMTNGSQQGIDLVTRALTTKVVATEDPSYWLGKRLFEMSGMKTVGLPIDPFSGLDEKVWQERLSENRPGLVYLTTNFQNPNGYSYTSAEISKIVHWAREFNFGILEDDWGSEMLSYSEFKPGLRATGGENVLYLNSFTKKLFPSLRIGYLAANDKTIEPLLMAKRVSTSATPGLIEAVLFEFLDRGYYDTHLRNIQEELDVRYDHCLNCLREFMPEEVKWTSPGGGPVLWLELPKRVNLDSLMNKLKDQGVLIQLPTFTFFQAPHSHGFKIGYAFLSQPEMEQGIEKLSKEIERQMSV
ncbi:MAG: PLP-dependent aminotransferase family protein [Bdellovibrionaceae bacterium]|nr:PLP-dependent aminotransferase family protein [Pseudobdellovibrionaceae bacterium]